jgi:endo-alpha-1,4-polygalactosaminidase (GH114 family)
MATGLKNAQEILPQVLDTVQFAVNEECVAQEGNGCTEYNDLLNAGKPVFHIEYADENDNNSNGKVGAKDTRQGVSQSTLDSYCVTSGLGSQLSTVVKYLDLDGWVEYCDGSIQTTAINENYQTGDPKGGKGGN